MSVGCLAASLTEQLAPISAALGLYDKCIKCQAHLLGASQTRWHQQQTGSSTLSFSIMPDSPKWWLIGTIKILTPLLNLFPFCFTADHSSPLEGACETWAHYAWPDRVGAAAWAGRGPHTPPKSRAASGRRHFGHALACRIVRTGPRRSLRGLDPRAVDVTFLFFCPRGDGAEIS